MQYRKWENGEFCWKKDAGKAGLTREDMRSGLGTKGGKAPGEDTFYEVSPPGFFAVICTHMDTQGLGTVWK